MKTLFVFDSAARVKNIPEPSGAFDTVCLFPLTSKTTIHRSVATSFKKAGYALKTIPTASVINASADEVRDKYIQFVADLPEKIKIKNKNLKEIFSLDEDTSLWWFSLIAEKNVFKSDSFNILAQLDAITRTAKQEGADTIIFDCRNKKLKNALREYCRQDNVGVKFSPVSGNTHLRNFRGLLHLKHITVLAGYALHMFLKTFMIKKKLGSLRRTVPQDDGSLMLLTPYPNIDEKAAEEGVFKNRFFIHLQDALESDGKKITWVAMYVRYSAISFKKSLEYAENFIKKGHVFFFLEEFNSVTLQAKAFFEAIKNGFRFLALKKKIREACSFEGYNIYSLFEDDWYSSFTGKTGYYGVLCYYMFKNMLTKLSPEKCVYPCEMRAWEKALISARDSLKSKTSLFACQSGTVPKMHLNFFNHPKEVHDTGKYFLPRPDRIACNGPLPLRYMSESDWPREKFSIVEALRYMHLGEYVHQAHGAKEKNTVLLVLSISPEESSSILTISHEALKDIKDVQVWIKPHPFLNLKKTFEFSGINEGDPFFQIKRGPVEDFFSKTQIVIAGESSAAVEALAFGCEVVIVNVPEWINMSPLRSVKSGAISEADSPEELKQIITGALGQGHHSDMVAEESERVINDFFCLNQTTKTPEKFLKLLKG